MSARKKINDALELADSAYEQALKSISVALHVLRGLEAGVTLTAADYSRFIGQLEDAESALLTQQSKVRAVRNTRE